VTIYEVLDNWIYWTLTGRNHGLTIALSLINTVYKSLQHPPSLFQPAVSSLDVCWRRLLTVAVPLLPGSGPLWTTAPFQMNYCCFNCPPYNALHGRSRKHRSQQCLYCYMRILCSGNVYTEQLLRNGSPGYNVYPCHLHKLVGSWSYFTVWK
jgi:hypothetical protein